MPGLPEYVCPAGEGQWRLVVWVQPGAKADGPAGTYQGALKIRLNAPAVDNKANEALTRYVADRLALRRSQVRLESGRTNRKKTLLVESRSEPRWERLAPRTVEQ